MISIGSYVSKNLFFFFLPITSICITVFFPIVFLQIFKQNLSHWSWEVVMCLWYVCRTALFQGSVCLLPECALFPEPFFPEGSVITLVLLSSLSGKIHPWTKNYRVSAVFSPVLADGIHSFQAFSFWQLDSLTGTATWVKANWSPLLYSSPDTELRQIPS